MSYRNQSVKVLRWEETGSPRFILTLCAAILLLLFIIRSASGQTVASEATNAELWGGTQDWNQFGLASLTAPGSGVILQGTAISGITGKPVRHLWYGDQGFGLCRLDPELDQDAPPVAGIALHQTRVQSCIGTIQITGFKPGQLAFDSSTNTLYGVNVSSGGAGVIRFHYDPTGDQGHGTIDPIRVDILMGFQSGRNAIGGCPIVPDPVTNQMPAQPDSASIGPDGNLYVGFKRGGEVIRILNPATMNPGSAGACQKDIQVPLFSADERLGNGHTFGMGWIGHTLFGADNIAPWVLNNADSCLTAANGMSRCGATAATEILASLAPSPQAGLITDNIYPNFPGNTLYAASVSTVTKIINTLTVGGMTVYPDYGGAFCLVTGLSADTQDLANEPLYVGADCTSGLISGAGQIWKLTPQPVAPGPPATPTNVVATAAVASASVTWSPTPNGQPVTQYVVRTLLASGSASVVPDVTIGATPGTTLVPNTTTISGLINGTSYEFEVQAVNSNGTSTFSLPSNVATPQALSAPGAPTGVSAVPGDSSATVAWTAPASNGNSPITSYTVTAAPSGITTTVAAPTTGAAVTGLTNGTSYTFTVQATNAIGSSSPSNPSNAITPAAPVGGADMSLAMSSPPLANPGAFVTYSMTVTNNGPQAAGQVVLTDTLPVTPMQSSTVSQGAACSAVGTTVTCNLGAMSAGASANVTITVAIGNVSMTNSASVKAFDTAGNVLTDPLATNNVATSTTGISAPGGTTTTTDIEVKGSAQNGGPNVGSADTLTWQIKDNQGKVAAPSVVFTLALPPGMQFNSASAGQASCTGITPGQSGGTLRCSLGDLAGGATDTVTVGFTAMQAGTLSATGSATFNGTDTNPSNNTFTVSVNAR